MAGETNVGTSTGAAEKIAANEKGLFAQAGEVAEQAMAMDPTKCKLVVPEYPERLGAQADHFLAAPLKQAGYDDRACITIVLVVTNQCCKAGVDNIAFAGYDKAKDLVVVQADDKNKMICVEAAKASKADPAKELSEMKARVEVLEKQVSELTAQKQAQDQAKTEQAKPSQTSESSADAEKKKSGGFFQWLGKAIDTFREKVQPFLKEFMERPFETIGKVIDAVIDYVAGDKEKAQPDPAVQQQTTPPVAAPSGGMSR